MDGFKSDLFEQKSISSSSLEHKVLYSHRIPSEILLEFFLALISPLDNQSEDLDRTEAYQKAFKPFRKSHFLISMYRCFYLRKFGKTYEISKILYICNRCFGEAVYIFNHSIQFIPLHFFFQEF